VLNKHFFFLILFFSISTSSLAKPQISIEMVAEKEITIIKDGKEIKKTISADEVEPGEIIHFTINYENTGNQPATNVVLNNPIPENSLYLPDTATGQNSDILFSIDGGTNFKKPGLLTYTFIDSDGKKVNKQAPPEKYTHIRWIVKTIKADSNGSVSFKVKVK